MPVIKARVHLIVSLPERDPFSFRTDVLCLTRDPEWAVSEATGCAVRALLAIKQRAHQMKIISSSVEWVPTLRDKAE